MLTHSHMATALGSPDMAGQPLVVAEHTFHPGHFSMKIPGQLSAEINRRGHFSLRTPSGDEFA